MKSGNQSRRDFLLNLSKGGFLLYCGNLGIINMPEFFQENDFYRYAPTAKYWAIIDSKGAKCNDCHQGKEYKPDPNFRHAEKIIKCQLCAQGCLIKEGQTGKCRARANYKGTLKSLVYGRPIATHVDPIEKKPFYHFLPGSSAYSIATAGCPLSCQFCQNWSLSQAKPDDYKSNYTKAEVIAENAEAGDVPVIAFTYNEPTVFIEYLMDIAGIAKSHNIKSVMISCGFMNQEPLKDLCGLLDAIKIDLKGFSEDFYRKVCSAELKPVLRSIRQIAQSKVHLEIVNLVVPTLNDSDRMLNYLTDWIVNEIGIDVPIHFTRFHPDYKLLNLPPTPVSTLEKAHDIARNKGIRYAYVGNVPGHKANSTYCPSCKKIVIKRSNFFVDELHLKNGKCGYCSYPIAGVWK